MVGHEGGHAELLGLRELQFKECRQLGPHLISHKPTIAQPHMPSHAQLCSTGQDIAPRNRQVSGAHLTPAKDIAVGDIVRCVASMGFCRDVFHAAGQKICI